MGLDKITLSLYDFLGYLLPGYIIFVAASVAEATFTSYNFFALTRLNKNMLLAAVAAYLMGQIAHSIASTLRTLKLKHLPDKAPKGFDLKLQTRVREVAKQTYGIEVDNTDNKANLHTYLLADTYVLTTGGLPEREMLTAREGFFKTSVVAFVTLALSLLASLAKEPKFQFGFSTYASPPKALIVGLAVASIALALLFQQRFTFFNRAKNTMALLAFLARRFKASNP